MILVTGGTGFVGPKIVHALRARALDVRLLVRNPRSASARRAESWGCELAQGDMTDAESLRRAVDGCEAVVHLVALAPFAAPDAFRRVMEEGTRDLVDAAKRAGVRRLVLMSALGTAPETREWTSYFHAKWEEEAIVQACGIPFVTFRPSYIFAPDGGILGGAIRAVRYSPLVPVVTPGRRMQPVWGEDVGAAFAQAVDLEAATNRTFDLVGPDVVTWAELWERVERVLGKRRANVRVPLGLVRAAAAAGGTLRRTRNARQAVAMLDSDNVGDIGPLTATFDVNPIGVTEQIRRAAIAA